MLCRSAWNNGAFIRFLLLLSHATVMVGASWMLEIHANLRTIGQRAPKRSSMRNSHFDSRRRVVLGTMLGGTGALMLGAALWPVRALAQSKAPIGIIGSGNIGGTI